MAGLIPAPIPAVGEFTPFRYLISASMAFDWRAGTYLSRTFGTPTDKNVWTLSFWMKRGTLDQVSRIISSLTGSTPPGVLLSATNQLEIRSDNSPLVSTTARQQDSSGHVHVVIRYNSDQVGASDRIRVTINGFPVFDFDSAVYPALGADLSTFNGANEHNIGRTSGGATQYFDGYLSEFIFVDGQELSPGNFGQFDPNTETWVPINYQGTYGNNGFRLRFDNAGNLGEDSSGNGNNWTVNNPDLVDGNQSPDTPTLNFCTLASNLQPNNASHNKGGLLFRGTGGQGTLVHASQVLPNEGKFYWEVHMDTLVTTGNVPNFGAARLPLGASIVSTNSALGGAGQDGFSYERNGDLNDHGSTQATFLPAIVQGDVIGFAVDMDTREVWLRRNGTWVGSGAPNPETGTDPVLTLQTGEYVPACGLYNANSRYRINFGQYPYANAAPEGFLPLHVQNRPAPTVRKAYDAVRFGRYDGTGSDQNITFSMAPDLIWIKSAFQAEDNRWMDSVRGAGVALVSNSNGAELTEATGLTEFRTDGFRVGTGVGGYNDNGEFFDFMALKAGREFGLDIVQYTGDGVARTLAHGLEAEPEFIIVKALGAANAWAIYHHESSITPEGERLGFDTAAAAADTTIWNNTPPTASVFSVGTSILANANGIDYIAYLFRGIPGFSKFGHYLGNGNANGPNVFMGLKPFGLFAKAASSAGASWFHNNVGFSTPEGNPNFFAQDPATAAGRGADTDFMDYLSQGIKLRTTLALLNTSGVRYVYAAWAEQPANWAPGVGYLPDYIF